MSAQNVEIVRTLFAYWDEDIGRSFELLSEDVEMHLATSLPGFAQVRRGHDAVREFWQEWLAAWEHVSVREFELEAAGDEVLGLWTQDMRGRGSDLTLAERQAAIFTVRDGRVTCVRYFSDQEQARAAFGR
jgi:ketosteroid isomerase-like protein